MKKTLVLLAVLSFTLMLNADYVIGQTSSSYYPPRGQCGQSFTSLQAGYITNIVISATGSTPSTTIKIYNGESIDPADEIYSEDISVPGGGTHDYQLNHSVTISDNTMYTFAIDYSVLNYTGDGNSYTSGRRLFDGIFEDDSDMYFQVYVATSPPAPTAPFREEPDDDTTSVPLDQILSWTWLYNSYTYDLWLGPVGNAVQVVSGAVVNGIAYEFGSYDPGNLNLGIEYEWWIVVHNPYTRVSTTGPTWSFTTEFELQPPCIETFDSYLPAGWIESSGYLADPTYFTSTTWSSWTHRSFGNIGGANDSAGVGISGTWCNYWLISPKIDLGIEQCQLEFDLALTERWSTNPSTLGVDDIFAVVVSLDEGASWFQSNALRFWDSTTPISNTGEYVTIDLSAYSGVIMLGFYVESTVANQDTQIYIDNVKINIVPGAPENIIVSESNGSVHLVWDVVTGATSYNVYSSSDPYNDFIIEPTGTEITEANCNIVITDENRFYYVTVNY